MWVHRDATIASVVAVKHRTDGTRERDQHYVFSGAIPRDLEAALAVAFSTLPEYRATDSGSQASFIPNDPSVLRDLAAAVVNFVATLKDQGEPPQNVLIALKTVLRRLTRGPSADSDAVDELQRLVVLAAVKAYFGHIDILAGFGAVAPRRDFSLISCNGSKQIPKWSSE
jgi:hypothetical protein